jgi:hypothetical protein
MKPGKGEPWIWSDVNLSDQVRRSQTHVVQSLLLDRMEREFAGGKNGDCKGELAENVLIDGVRGGSAS